jgi:hypothetical protein
LTDRSRAGHAPPKWKSAARPNATRLRYLVHHQWRFGRNVCACGRGEALRRARILRGPAWARRLQCRIFSAACASAASGVIGQGQLEVSHQEMRLRSSTHSTVRPIGNCWHLAYEMRTGSHLSRLSLGLSRTRRFKSATETDRGSATNGRLPCYHERGVSRRPARPQHDAFGDMIEVAPALFGIT